MKALVLLVICLFSVSGCQLMSACANNPAACADVVTTTVTTGKKVHDAAKRDEADDSADSTDTP